MDLILLAVSIFFILYFSIYITFMFLSVMFSAYRLYIQNKEDEMHNVVQYEYYPPISILVPAHNEEVTIVESIQSLLRLEYRIFEIIVVDDGSTDQTGAKLIEAFQMHPSIRPVRMSLPCKPMRQIYETTINHVQLTLIQKENGGKGDSLNMGINASRFPWFICQDADSLLQRDSLKKIMQPVLENENIIAVGGRIFAQQGMTMVDGMPVSYRLPRKLIVCMQVMEYERSFLASRIFMNFFNGNLIISGAFGLFRKDIVIASGGYDANTLGEDMELVVKMHTFCRNNQRKYLIYYEPTAICWSQVPESYGDIRKQRRRWHLGLFQSMKKYRQLFANARYGTVSFVSYTYYLLYELFSPVIELAGLLFTLLFFVNGYMNAEFMVYFLLLYILFGMIYSFTIFFQKIYVQKIAIAPIDIAKSIVIAVVESLFFRYFLSFVRTTAFIGYKKNKENWGSITRNKI